MSTMNVAPQQLAKAHLHYLQSNSVFPPLGSRFPFSFLRLKPYRSYCLLHWMSKQDHHLDTVDTQITSIRGLPLFPGY